MSSRPHISFLFLLTLTLCACGGDSLQDAGLPGESGTAPRGDNPVVSAHRGGAAYAPENTLPAMDNAIRLGVDQLETDTQLTADGVLVLIHDDTLDRTTDCSGPVNAKILAELQECDAAFWFSPGQPTTSPNNDLPHPLRGEGIGIPTAEALFAKVAVMGDDSPEISIEIKDIPGESNFDPVGVEVANVLVPLIQQFGLQDKVIVQSFWPTAIDAVKMMDPSIRTQFLTSSDFGVLATEGLSFTVLRGHDIVAPNFDAPDMTAEFVEAAHQAGKQVIPWTIDEQVDQAAITELGVDGLITNFPACLLTLQGRRGSGEATPAGMPAIEDCPVQTVTESGS